MFPFLSTRLRAAVFASVSTLLLVASASFLPAQVLEGGTLTLGESSGGTLVNGGTLSFALGGSFSLSSLDSNLSSNEVLSGYSLLIDTDGSLDSQYLNQSLTLDSGSTLQLNIDTTNMEASTLNVQGDLSSGNSTLVLDDVAATPAAVALGSTFTLLHYTGSETGEFDINGTSVADGGSFTLGANTFEVNYAEGDPDVTITAIAAPEPSTWALLGISLVCAAFLRRRRGHLLKA